MSARCIGFSALPARLPSALCETWRPRLERRALTLLALGLPVAVLLALGRNVRLAGIKPFSLTLVTGVTATLMIAAVMRVAWRRRSFLVVSGIVALFALAVICQLGDRPGGWLFTPHAPLQAHAIWHVLAALATVLAVRSLEPNTTAR